MLPESDLSHVDSNLLQEKTDTRKEITERLIINDLVLDCLADRHLLDRRLASKLGMPVQEFELNVFNFMETFMPLAAIGIDN